MTLQFPDAPFQGQSFVASNGVSYTYDNGGWIANSQSGLDDRYVNITGDNMTGDLTLGTDNIQLNADGSATFVGLVSVQRDVSGDGCFHAGFGGTTYAAIASDGSATFGNDPTTGAKGVKLLAPSGIVYACNTGSNAVWRGYAEGSTGFKSEIRGDGNATFVSTRSSNVFLNLEPDNPANYTTTMVDGVEEQVYNGRTLDVKELLLTLQTAAERIETLEAKVQSLEGVN